MVKGRKPLASAIKEASGAYVKDPQRRNKEEPKAKRGWPEAPAFVVENVVAHRRWKWVCKQLDEMALLTVADEGLIAGYCIDYAMMVMLVEHIKDGVSIMNDKGGVVGKPEASHFHKFADRIMKREAELGLTPSSRSRLRAPQEDEEDPFQEWLSGATSRRDN
jgi:P27 family predicted phage terminase small subunit